MQRVPLAREFILQKFPEMHFLFVLGVFVTFISNIQAAIASAPAAQGPFGFSPWGMVIGATVIATARWNPFYGLLTGVAIKVIFGL